LKALFWREVLPDLSWRHRADTRREVIAGLVGAVLVIPQAITFAYLVGVPPEYGLYCAVFVAFIASLFGGSALVGGPNTALSILLSLAIMPYAGRGSPLYIEYVLLISLIVGVMQLVLWIMRAATLFRYISPAAIAGIKMGVGVLLITSALEGVFGVSDLNTQFFYERLYVLLSAGNEIINPYSTSISLITLVSALMLKRRYPRAYILIALALGTLLSMLIDLTVGPLRSEVELLGRIHMELLPLHWPNMTREVLLVMQDMLPNAFAIAVLGLAQSLVIARDLKTHVSPHIDMHKEVFAQGISNVAGAFTSGFAGAGSFNRTSVAVEMGARTALSGLVAAVAVMAIAWGLAPLFTHLPMPAVAAVMALVGIGMLQVKEMRFYTSNRMDAVIFAATWFTVAFIGLSAGILVASLGSLLVFVFRVSKLTFDASMHGDQEIIHVQGSLSYASMDELAAYLSLHPRRHTTVDLSSVSYRDATASALLEQLRAQREAQGGGLLIKT